MTAEGQSTTGACETNIRTFEVMGTLALLEDPAVEPMERVAEMFDSNWLSEFPVRGSGVDVD